MSITINGYDDPPCIMLDGEHLKLNFDMGSKCDSPAQEDDGLTAFLHFSLDDKGCACTAALAGRNAAETWLTSKTVPCHGHQELSPSEFGEWTGDVTVPKQAIINLAFGKPHEIDMEELRREVLGKFHDNLKKFDLLASCKWDRRGLHLYVTMSQFGTQKLRFDFDIPYESAVVVLQDKRRKTA